MIRTRRFLAAGLILFLTGWFVSGWAENKPPKQTPSAGQAKSAKSTGKKQKPAEESAAPVTPPKTDKGDDTETAVFAGGCFWCTEFAFEQLEGVIDVESGYAGGTKATANYDQVHLGTTGHAEVIRVTYDPKKVTFEKLLDAFFDSHDPTQLNRQGADEGRQYRSAIFYADDEQEKQAKAKIADLEARKVFKRKIMTKLEPLKEFFPAEDYHQDFARKNPYVPYIQGHAIPNAFELRKKRPELIRKE